MVFTTWLGPLWMVSMTESDIKYQQAVLSPQKSKRVGRRNARKTTFSLQKFGHIYFKLVFHLIMLYTEIFPLSIPTAHLRSLFDRLEVKKGSYQLIFIECWFSFNSVTPWEFLVTVLYLFCVLWICNSKGYILIRFCNRVLYNNYRQIDLWIICDTSHNLELDPVSESRSPFRIFVLDFP